ncbi:MAG TPA: AsmA-like C-terminal domain-containing protein [Geminicoccaceae bacterium]|nr:AsmA-like C-terminal domain-containing protein [Geminicoccaceae bacterium]
MIRRISHAAFRLSAALMAIIIIAIAALGARIATGPIQLAWLTPYVERALAPADQRVRVEVGDAQLRLGDDRVVELVGLDVRATGPGGESLVELPEVEVGISLRALLRRGMLAPTSLQARAPRLLLARDEDGTIDLGALTAGERAPRGELDINALLAALFSTDTNRPLSYLDRLVISGGELILQDRVTNHTIMARGAELTVSRWSDGLVAELAFELEQAGEPARVRTAGRLDATSRRVSFTLDFERLSAAELAGIVPILPLAGVDLMLDGRLAGAVDLEGALSPLTFEVRSGGGVIDRPDLLAGPLPVESARVAGQLAADLRAITLAEARLATKGASIGASARIAWRDQQITVWAEVAAENVAARDLELYWPPAIGREARAWVVANITDGVVPKAEATITFQPGDLDQRPIPEATVGGQFEFADLTLRYYETMPPLTGVDGNATFTARRMDFAVAGGRVGEVAVDDGSVVITGIGIKGRDTTQLEITAEIDSPIADALALIDHPPLGFAGDLGVAPGGASGRTRTHLAIGMPLHRDLDESEIRVKASADLVDAGLKGLPGAIDMSDGRFRLTVDDQGADLAGEAALNRIPLAIEWRENFADDAPFERRFHLQGRLDSEDPRRLGLELPVAAQGSFGLDATVLEAAKVVRAEVALDLEALAIDAPKLGWRKSAGEAGRLTAALLVPRDGPIHVEAFELASSGFEATGSLDVSTAPMQIERLALTRLRAGRSTGALDLSRQEQGYEIRVRAETLDLDAVLEARAQAESAQDESAPPTPLSLMLAADRVLLRGQGLSGVDAHLVRDARGWRTAGLWGRLPKGGSVALTLAAEAGQRRLRLTTDDAGDLLHTLDQTTHIGGGELELRATLAQQVPTLAAQGTFSIHRFTLLDAPILARLLTVASLTGIGSLLGGEGIYFDRLELPFSLREDVLSIDRGRMSGSQLGLTVKGNVDLARDQLDLQGTVVPVYGLNRMIGKIPLVGPFLSGSEGEGAFAATYSMTGPLSEPQIRVNPLAVLAPGFLRELFSGLSEGSLDPPVVPNPSD